MLKVQIRIRSDSDGTSAGSTDPHVAQQNSNNGKEKIVLFIFVSAYGRQQPVCHNGPKIRPPRKTPSSDNGALSPGNVRYWTSRQSGWLSARHRLSANQGCPAKYSAFCRFQTEFGGETEVSGQLYF
jgi:hypothetical protein